MEFTTTGCCRPAVFRRTLASFYLNLLDVDWAYSTLYLNVDPVPSGKNALDMLEVAESYFGNVILNAPEQPSFPAAVKWCWRQPKGTLFFHLEDDWEMIGRVSIQELQQLFEGDPGLTTASLRAYPWADGENRICLSPGLFRTSHAITLASRITVLANPERQLRPHSPENPHGGCHVGFRGAQYPKIIVLKDIGREWLDQVGWRKERPVHFTRWEQGHGVNY